MWPSALVRVTRVAARHPGEFPRLQFIRARCLSGIAYGGPAQDPCCAQYMEDGDECRQMIPAWHNGPVDI